MLRKWVICGAATMMLAASAAFAGSLEFTPFGGYAVGGDFNGLAGPDSELDAAAAYGLLVDVPVAPDLQLELFLSHQGTELSGSVSGAGGTLADVDVDYFHVGVLQGWEHGNTEPYWVFSVGVTQFSPDGYDSSTQPSVGLGGGVKVFLSRDAFLGFRFGGRILGTYFDDREIFCNSGGCLAETKGSFIVQGQGEIGLVIRF